MTFRYDTRIGLRTISAIAFLSLIGGLSACGNDTRACNECPPLAGRWDLTFDQRGTLPTQCASMEVQLPGSPSALTLTQVGSELSGELEGMALRGTALDTWDFSLNGTAHTDGGSTTLSVTGRYGPGGADGGELLSGTYSASHARDGQTCMFSRSYTGARAP